MAGRYAASVRRARDAHIMTICPSSPTSAASPAATSSRGWRLSGGDRDRRGGARVPLRAPPRRRDADGPARRRACPSPRRPAHRFHDRSAPQLHGPARVDRIGRRTADGGAAGSDRARRRLRHVGRGLPSHGRPAFRRAGGRRRARHCPRRTECSASSAITTTIATCRPRWPTRGVEILQGRAHARDRPGRAARSHRGSVLDDARARHRPVARGAAKASILLAHNPSRLKEARRSRCRSC